MSELKLNVIVNRKGTNTFPTGCDNIARMAKEKKAQEAASEGRKLRELLERAHKRPVDLARACEVTQTAVARYLAAETLGARAWERVSAGLSKLGIDPRQVRQPPPLTFIAREAPEDLRPLLQSWSRKQLEALLKILEATEEARYVLSIIVKDRLEREPRD